MEPVRRSTLSQRADGAPSPPPLPEGIVAFVKRDCPTCALVAPVLAQLARAGGLTVYSQDDPAFPPGLTPIDDRSLSMSWHHQIEAVPTLIRVRDGAESERVLGWQREEWQALTGVENLGAGLPDWRPGCGSLSVDPALAPDLAVRFAASRLRARRIPLAPLEDEFEALYERGWSDGLPLVPPTEIGRLSGTGWATGYVGGIITLVLVLGFLAANPGTDCAP